MPFFEVILSDGITTQKLGRYEAKTSDEAADKARKKYRSMFNRLVLPQWRVSCNPVASLKEGL